jgi:hypothetical protein
VTAADRPVTPADRPVSVADWEARLRGLARALAEFAGPARRVGVDEQAAAQRSHDRTVERARDAAAVQRADVARALRAALASAHATAGRRLAELATGPASAPFGGPGWESVGVAVPLAVRVGTVVAPGLDPALPEVPVVVPLLGSAGWVVEGEPDGLVLGTVLRVIAAAPPLRVRVDSYDPGLTGALGAFGPLRAQSEDIVAGSMTGEVALADHVAELTEAASRRGALLGEGAAFEELSGPLVEPYRLLVLLDYPSGVDGEVHRQLVRVAASAAGRGLCLLVHHNPDRPPAHGVEPGELLSRLRRFRARNDRWEIEGLPAVACRRDPAPPAGPGDRGQRRRRGGGGPGGTAHSGPGRPAAGAGHLVGPGTGRRRRRAACRRRDRRPGAGVAAPAKRQPAAAQPARRGCGRPGQVQPAARTGPRPGGALSTGRPADVPAGLQAGPGVLGARAGSAPAALAAAHPGARVYADREFGLAVLRHVERELDRRSELFKSLGGITDIATIGPHVERRPPRVLLVLDEFQVMLAADDDIAEEAAALLEKLVRLGRAYGLHVVLATQTLEGIPRLALKRDAIFGQVPYRIVLKTTPSDSQAMLQLHNTAAAGLRFRGQAVFNDNFGTLDANRQVLIARADPGELDRLRREAVAARPRSAAPRVRARRRGRPRPRAGPLRRTAAPRRRGRAGLVGPAGRRRGGSGRDRRPARTGRRPAAARRRRRHRARGARRGRGHVGARGARARRPLPAAGSAARRPALAAGREALVNRLGGAVERSRAADIPRRLYELRDAVRARSGQEPPLHVFGLGLHRAVRLTTPVPGELDPPSDALREVAHQGAPVGVFLYGWWNRLKACRDHLGSTHPSARTCSCGTRWTA